MARQREKEDLFAALDDVFDESMNKLDESMRLLDDDMDHIDARLDESMSDMDQKLEKALAAVQNVVNAPYVPLKTKKSSPRQQHDIYNRDGTLSEHVLKTAQEISNRVRDRNARVKQTVTFTDKYTIQEPRESRREILSLNIWAENFLGHPIKSEAPKITIDTKVRVAARSGLGQLLLPNHPNYQVFIKDTEVWMRKMEDMMFRSSLIAGNEAVFVESWTKNWTVEESRFLQQALKGITALQLNRKYHDETLSVLNKRLSKQRDGNGDVGNSVGADGGS